jgi:RNA 2',3'-cyclic 3'-phosphodiesterase
VSRRGEAEPPPADERWRCFVAIGIAEPARTAVVEYLERLRSTVAGVAWVKPDNLHLTLRFLGNVAATRVPGLTEQLRLTLAPHPGCELRVAGVGAFPSLARPQALWIGVGSPRLTALAAAVEAACERAGFGSERRAFRPHVTLGRVRARHPAPDLTFLARDGGRELGITPVGEVVLFRSVLQAQGARHSVLASVPLAAGIS